MPSSVSNRRLMKVEAHKLRFRECFSHDERRCAVTAADVGDLAAALKLSDDAVERRQPLSYEVRAVAGSEKTLSSAKKTIAVLAPIYALPALESRRELGL